MQNKKLLTIFVFSLLVLGATKTFASLTFSDSAITGTSASSLDLGAGNNLYIQTSGGKVGIGTTAPSVALDVVGSVNIPSGSAYMYNGVNLISAQTSLSNYFFGKTVGNLTMTGRYNNIIGTYAFGANTTGSDNTVIGLLALSSNTTGSRNTAIGSISLGGNTTGSDNNAIGYYALGLNSTGTDNVAFGSNALASSTASFNVAIGSSALFRNTTGASNVSVGHQASVWNLAGSNNVAIGKGTLFANDGSNNTAIGANALRSGFTDSGNVALGYYAGGYETGSNAFYVDNQDRTNTAGDKAGSLLYGQFNATPANQILTVNASLGIGTTTPTAKLNIKDGKFASSQTTPPTASVTGTGYSGASMVTGSTDTKGGITATVGAAAGTLVVTFQSAYPTAPICTVSPATATGQVDLIKTYVTSSTSALTLNFVATPVGGSETWNYICLQ